jgi:hypothetical protein
LIRQHHQDRRPDHATHHRHRRGPDAERRHHHIPLTPEGVPAAIPDAPRPSAVVFVSDESRAKHPWLPPRVIARSVWRGPGHLRVRVDERGDAVPWRRGGRSTGTRPSQACAE